MAGYGGDARSPVPAHAGWQLGKAVLHATQLAVLLPWLMAALWSPLLPAAAALHLRVFLLLRLTSLTLSALQLRSGYPGPGAQADGRAPRSLYDHTDTAHLVRDLSGV